MLQQEKGRAQDLLQQKEEPQRERGKWRYSRGGQAKGKKGCVPLLRGVNGHSGEASAETRKKKTRTKVEKPGDWWSKT